MNNSLIIGFIVIFSICVFIFFNYPKFSTRSLSIIIGTLDIITAFWIASNSNNPNIITNNTYQNNNINYNSNQKLELKNKKQTRNSQVDREINNIDPKIESPNNYSNNGSNQEDLKPIGTNNPDKNSIVNKAQLNNCEQLSTGDYCIKNHTTLTLHMAISAKPFDNFDFFEPSNTMRIITIIAGDRECVYNLNTGVHFYYISEDELMTYVQYKPIPNPYDKIKSPFIKKGEMKVELCQSKVLEIKK